MSIVCYIPMLEGQSAEVQEWADGVQERFGVIVRMLPPVDWNDDLTPWPAPPIFRKGKPFGGKADAYLASLLRLEDNASERWFLGVSLAGLFGIWASAQTPIFTKVAAISGSFWYPGFVDWAQAQTFQAKAYYLSLGDREAESKNPHLKGIVEDTDAVVQLLNSQGIPTRFEWTSGTHFGPMVPRLDKAIQGLL